MIEAAGNSDPGCVRKNNEDKLFINQALGLYVLADGMGGAQAGETAAQIAIDAVVDYVRGPSNVPRETLVQAFELANQKVREEAATAPHLNGMGTTLVAVLECGNELAIASVGDSRAYLVEGNAMKAITQDQTWANEVGRRLGLNDQQLKTHPMRHVLTMAIGVDAPLRVHSYKVAPGPDVQILLCSDGLHGVVNKETIGEQLNATASLEDKCCALIELARQAGGPDNITAVLLHHSGSNNSYPQAKNTYPGQ